MKTNVPVFVAVVFALGVVGYLLLYRHEVPAVTPEGAETSTYSSPEYGISFDYSPTYYLKEVNAGTPERPQLAVVLVEDTAENRSVIDGTATTARDGPPSITVVVYPNPDRLTSEDWVRADTNWTIRTSEAAPIGRGSITGVTYSWSGLYEGKSVIVTEGTRAYVFSVTWMTPEDPILNEFDALLNSVQIQGGA